MKKIRFCIAALVAAFALTAPLFAEGVEINSKTDLPGDSEAGSTPITPSRSVTLKSGQYLDIGYPGTGWIYLGEIEGSSLLKYEKRELGNGDTFFTLLAKAGGTATLHFYKSDALAGSYIDDYLTVTVSGASRNKEHVEAPSYADIVPPRPSFTQSSVVAQALQEKEEIAAAVSDSPSQQLSVQPASTPASSSNSSYISLAESGGSEDDRSATVIQTSSPNAAQTAAPAPAAAQTSSSTAAISTATAADDSSKKADTAQLSEREILDLAQKAYESKDYQGGLSYLADFFDKAVSLTDAGLYLKGQILEAPSASRNIKEALASYKAIVSNYPESELWDDAAKRISYIERIYFDIR
ncbi:MAG: hypothetical protein J6Y13_10870 [Treponema sp.]|nr:hypothetical protein [Treponema sp.]